MLATMAIPLALAWTDCSASGDDEDGPAVAAANRRTAKFFSVSFGSRYTEDDFRRMAEKLDLLIIDPFSFREVPGVLKQTNPGIKVLGYCNTFDIEDLSRFADRDLTPLSKTAEMLDEWKRADAGDWFYLDPKGRRVNVYLNKVDNRYGLDLGKPQVRAFLAAKAKGIVARGYDGVFLDNVGVRYPYGFGVGEWVSAVPSGLTERKWWDDSVLMLRAIKQAVGDKPVIFNQVRGYNPEVSLEFVAESDGAMDESWLSDGNFKPGQWRQDVGLIERLNKLNAYTVPIAQGRSEQAAKALFASYLLAKHGDRAYFAYGPYNFTQWKWCSFYDVDLGRPLGGATESANVVQRRYQRGIVLLNISDSLQEVALPDTYQTEQAEKVTRLRLPGRNGELLYTLDVPIELPKTLDKEYAAGTEVDFSKRGPAAEKTIVITLEVDPAKASSAKLQLMLFDADNPDEGEIVINRKQTIPLPCGKGAAYNWLDFSFDPIPINTATLVRGENRITIRRHEGGVFKVTELTLRLAVPRE